MFASIVAGGFHTCGLTASGVAYCWGENIGGEIGDGTFVARNVPTPVHGDLRFSSLSAGYARTCGMALDGFAYCWGANANVHGGIPSPVNSTLPVRISGQM